MNSLESHENINRVSTTGENPAFPPAIVESLYLQMNDQLCGRATAHLGSLEDAEDMVQNLYVALLANDSYQDQNKAPQYLQRALTTDLIDEARSQARHPQIPLDSLDAIVPLPVLGVEQQIINAETMALLVTAINGLASEAQRQVLQLDMQGLSYEEIYQTGCFSSIGQIKSLIFRGKENIKAAILERVGSPDNVAIPE